ncbi:hypothetical protein J6590_011534 [Homalodisca vitripennis]|nr:hypothetical protein J6590_011534 [Homalodisca vitripennis]
MMFCNSTDLLIEDQECWKSVLSKCSTRLCPLQTDRGCWPGAVPRAWVAFHCQHSNKRSYLTTQQLPVFMGRHLGLSPHVLQQLIYNRMYLIKKINLRWPIHRPGPAGGGRYLTFRLWLSGGLLTGQSRVMRGPNVTSSLVVHSGTPASPDTLAGVN